MSSVITPTPVNSCAKLSSYHSALTPELEAKPLDKARLGESLAFRHDLRKGLPAQYEACDVFYTDLPWQDGFPVFEERAGSKGGGDYEEFLKAVSVHVLKLAKPTVLVTGKLSLRHLPAADSIHFTHLNGAPAVAVVYHTSLHDSSEAHKILDELAIRFDCVGDFCCGYGRTAKTFHIAGKRFVVSDYNAACIGRMAAEWKHWMKA